MATNLRAAENRSPRPDIEARSDAKQQEKIRQREKDRQDRAEAMAASIRAKATAAAQAEKRRNDKLAKQKQAEADKKQQERAEAMAASIRAKAKAANLAEKQRKEQLAKLADYKRRRGIYQDAIAGMEDISVNPTVQGLIDQTTQAGLRGIATVKKVKRGGPIGYTKRWSSARRKSKT